MWLRIEAGRRRDISERGDVRREKRAYKCSHCSGRHASRFCKEQGRDTELEQLAEDSDSSDSDTETDRDQGALTVIPEPPLPPQQHQCRPAASSKGCTSPAHVFVMPSAGSFS